MLHFLLIEKKSREFDEEFEIERRANKGGKIFHAWKIVPIDVSLVLVTILCILRRVVCLRFRMIVTDISCVPTN